jgi:hypothetical protein
LLQDDNLALMNNTSLYERRLLADPALDRRLAEDGYVVVDALDAAGVAHLTDVYNEVYDGSEVGFAHQAMLEPGARRARQNAATREAFVTYLSAMLPDQQVLSSGFIVKAATGESPIVPHADWSFVDEARDRSLNVFIAIGDIDASNGGLAVTPRSHLLPWPPRGTGTAYALAVSDELMRERLSVVALKSGQAILYDPRLLHASETNRSGKPRIFATMAVAPADATVVHYVRTGDVVREVEVDLDFYATLVIQTGATRGVRDIEKLLAGRPSRQVDGGTPITTEQFRQLLDPPKSPLRRMAARFR